MFINITNHRYTAWSERQREAALLQFGEFIEGLEGFPPIDPRYSKEDVARAVRATLSDIDGSVRQLGLNPADVSIICQGEMCFTIEFVRMANIMGYRCFAATSERKTVETQLPNGNTAKTAIFEFVQFREY